MRVVVLEIDWEDALEVASVDDQEPVEALAADRADPSLGERVRVRCSYRCSDRSYAFSAEHLVACGGELAVSVVDQEADRLCSFDERLDDVPCLLGDPGPAPIRPDARQMNLARPQIAEYQDVQTAERH